MNLEQKTELALKLIERCEGVLTRRAEGLRHSNWRTQKDNTKGFHSIKETRFRAAMRLLEIVREHIVDEIGPDVDWFRDYFLVTGDHVILTEYGWEPSEARDSYLADDSTWEPLDELNAPIPQGVSDAK